MNAGHFANDRVARAPAWTLTILLLALWLLSSHATACSNAGAQSPLLWSTVHSTLVWPPVLEVAGAEGACKQALRIAPGAEDPSNGTVSRPSCSEVHTYFVAAGQDAPAVWVHNACTWNNLDLGRMKAAAGNGRINSSTSPVWRAPEYSYGTPRNAALAGGTHPVTGVPFNSRGFPDFGAHVAPGGDIRINLTGSRSADFAAADRAFGPRPPGQWTWHHHEDVGLGGIGARMQLVPTNVHGPTGHSGGVNVMENTFGIRYGK